MNAAQALQKKYEVLKKISIQERDFIYCLENLKEIFGIYEKYEKKCPNYQFYIDEDNKHEGGIYICLEKEIQKMFTFEPGQTYSMGMIIPFIEDYVDTKKIHIGILSCRTTEACSDVIVALPGKASNHASMLNPATIHRSFRRTVNQRGEENRKGIHPAVAMLTRKRKRKRNKTP